MHPKNVIPRRLLCSALAVICWLFGSVALSAQESQAGLIRGTVSSSSTLKYLEGVVVSIVQLDRQVITDREGRYEFGGLASGEYVVTTSYMGMADESARTTVIPGKVTDLSFSLRENEVYELKEFVVKSEREGNAAALTRQRTSPNVKAVVAMDALGPLANENPAELLSKLSGVTANYTDEGDITTINIRGIDPNLSSVTIDGAKMATSNGLTSRNFRFLNINAGFFDELEVIKAPTPNMSAESLGGTVNLKNKSSFTMKEKRRITYRLGGKWAAPFYDYIPRKEADRFGPLVSLGYQEKFDVLGGKNNFGISMDLFYTDNITNVSKSQLDWQFTTDVPAYTYNYQTFDTYNKRNQKAINLRADYKISDNWRVYVAGMVTHALEFTSADQAGMQVNVVAPRSVLVLNSTGGVVTNGAIMPGYNENYTEARASGRADSRSQIQLTFGPIGFLDKQSRVQAGAEQTIGEWTLDYNANYSRSRVLTDGGKSGDNSYAGRRFQTTLTGFGWSLNQAQSREYPVFTHTGGPDIYNPESYVANSAVLERRGGRDSDNYEAHVNARRQFFLGDYQSIFTAGASWRRQELAEWARTRQYAFRGTTLAPFVDDIQRDPRFGPGIANLPTFNLQAVSDSIDENPALWLEDIYSGRSQSLLGTRDIAESVTAAYAMTQTRFGKLSVLAGARFERTDVEGNAWLRPRQFSNISDVDQRILAEFGQSQRHTEGGYEKFFPGVHFTYNFAKNLIGRVSWSTAIGRPIPLDLIPVETPNFTAQTLTISNPSLDPQFANNYDLGLEYYLKPVGVISFGLFRKDITDFIFTDAGGVVDSESPYYDQYPNFTLITKGNGGSAKVEGIELSYEQALTFLPKPFNGISVRANYTRLRTAGNYGDAGVLSTNSVAGFIPEAANASLTYNYRKWRANLSYAYSGGYLITYASDPSRLLFKESRALLNGSLSYRFKPSLEVFLTVLNMTDEPSVYYRGIREHRQATVYNGPNIDFGVTGRF